MRLTIRDRVHAWLVTGPIGRLAGFLAELTVQWWRWARTRRDEAAGARGAEPD